MHTDDTICAIATAQGGAIGIIRVSGPEAITITDKIFTPISGQKLITRKPYTLTFGHILSSKGEVIDEWIRFEVTKLFNSEQEPDSQINITYEKGDNF